MSDLSMLLKSLTVLVERNATFERRNLRSTGHPAVGRAAHQRGTPRAEAIVE